MGTCYLFEKQVLSCYSTLEQLPLKGGTFTLGAHPLELIKPDPYGIGQVKTTSACNLLPSVTISAAEPQDKRPTGPLPNPVA